MTAKVITKGRHVLGKLSRACTKDAPRNCEAALTWELCADGDRLEFAACGEVWNHLKTDIVRGGQCVGELAALFPRDVLAQRIRRTWERYHLNGMNAGTPEQAAHVDTLPDDVRRDYSAVCASLAAANLLEVRITDGLRAKVGGLPADAKAYRYGSRWLHYPLPDDVVALIRNGFRVDASEDVSADPAEAGEPDSDPIAALGLTVDAEFIPFSRSRNAAEKSPSLNWRVTLKRNGAHVLTCDYSEGSAHCPVHRNAQFKRTASPRDMRAAIAQECETGKAVKGAWSLGAFIRGEAIKPDARAVISSLLLDSAALDCGTFENWCAEYGYEADSMKARATFDQCLAHALAFRGAIGGAAFDALREANE